MNCAKQAAPRRCEMQSASRDEQLVRAALAGSKAAFAELQTLYSLRLYRRIVLITKNHEDAEDALQDTFLRTYLALGSFEGRSNFSSWLTRIAINSALMTLRKRRLRAEVLFESSGADQDEFAIPEARDSAPNPEQEYSRRQQLQHLLNAIRGLDPHLQDPIEIQLTRECSMKEIARTLDISVAAVKSRLHRARRRLALARDLRRTELEKKLTGTHKTGCSSSVGVESRHV